MSKIDLNDVIVAYFDIKRSDDKKRITLIVERADDESITGEDAVDIILHFIENNGDNMEQLLESSPDEGCTLN